MIRVLIVDGQAQVCSGLRMRLGIELDIAVVGTAEDVEEALALARALDPDVIVADIGMRGACGTKLIRSLRFAAPKASVVVLTLRGDEETRAQAQQAGAHAFLEKIGEASEVLQAIRQVAPRCGGDAMGVRGWIANHTFA